MYAASYMPVFVTLRNIINHLSRDEIPRDMIWTGREVANEQSGYVVMAWGFGPQGEIDAGWGSGAFR